MYELLYYTVQMKHTIVSWIPKFHNRSHEADNGPLGPRIDNLFHMKPKLDA
jgi:hypothetical protein